MRLSREDDLASQAEGLFVSFELRCYGTLRIH
jgi:hypothetical protein